MRGLRARSPLAALVVALLLATVAPTIGVGEAAIVRGAATDLTLVTDALYTVDPEAGHVGVAMTVTARNRTTETRTRRFWFDHAFLAVQPGATNLRVSGPKGARVRVARKDAQSTLLRIDFGARLYSGKGAVFRVRFDLPGSGKAASPQVRVGTSLITIPVWAYASTGARGSTVTVRMPPGWDVAVESGEFAKRSTTGTGATVLESGPIGSPLSFFAFVSAQQPAVYVDRPLTLPVGDQQVELVIQAWEDDDAWARRTGELFEGVLPVLRRDIGLPWPLAEPLVVAESVNRDAGAYAGIFDPDEGRMEVAYWAGPDVMIHQAAHGWFNGGLLADRWANEGFATFYALRAAAEQGLKVAAPELTEEVAAAAVPLNAWTRDETPGSPVDGYGYAASTALATAIAEAVGTDVMALAWADADSRTGAYQPPAAADARPGAAVSDPPETVADAPDWRGLLDLLEARSGKDLTGLWREWVVGPEEATLLDARAQARSSYERTLSLAGDWRLPRPVRDALRAWDFETAEALMADARTVIAQRNAIEGIAQRDGVTLTGTMRGLFESGAMAEASAQAEAERAALLAIEDAEAARSADDDILSRIGMFGEHPEQSLREAKLLIAQGDLEGSTAASDRALRAWTIAWQEGRRRALLALAVLATVLVLATAVLGSVRRARRPAPGVAVAVPRGSHVSRRIGVAAASAQVPPATTTPRRPVSAAAASAPVPPATAIPEATGPARSGSAAPAVPPPAPRAPARGHWPGDA